MGLAKIIERSLQVLVEAMIDIGERASAADVMRRLQGLGIIRTADRYIPMVRFRNFLVHQLLGIIQDALSIERVDLIFLNVTENVSLQREALKGRLLLCRDPELYASFFSLTDRRGRDEEDRIARAWKMSDLK